MASPLFSALPLQLIVPLLLALFLIYSLTNLAILCFFTSKKQNFPPSPPKLPIIGNLHQLSSTHPHHCLHAMSKKHGPIMLLQLGQVKTLVLSSMDMAREVMKTQDQIFCSRPSLEVPKLLLNNGLDIAYAPYGEYWRQMKKISVLHLLSAKMVQSFRSIREEEVAYVIKHIYNSCELGPIDVSKSLKNMSKYIISKVSLGSNSREEKWYEIIDAIMPKASQMMGSFFVGDYFPSLPWLHKVTGVESMAKNTKKPLDAVLDKILDEHVKVSKEDEYEPKDFIGVLLSLQKDPNVGKFITKESIYAIITDMFAAGMESTYIVMEWAMAELIKHPSIMKTLKDEIRSIVGDKRGTVNEDDLKAMDYLKHVIKEAMRLHPPGPLLVPRESMQDTKINGYDIPAGSLTFINVWSIGRDANLWESPDEFKPERFIGKSKDFRGQDYDLTPLGAGRRICPGIGYAAAVIELGLANMVHQFEWSLPEGMEKEILDMTEVFGITMRKRTGLKLMAKPLFRTCGGH